MTDSAFSALVTDHWLRDISGPTDGAVVRVVLDASLSRDHPLSLLRVAGGPSVLAVTPDRAVQLRLSAGDRVDASAVISRIADAGIPLNDPDHIFYLPVAEQAALRAEPAREGTRRLTAHDQDAFARFAREAPEDEFDDAFVELDHWLVFGTFVGDRLVAAASMYPWHGTRLADLGVITLPDQRGQGRGRTTVRAISAHAIEQGYEPQYRCQTDNAPSVALARSSGFAHFGVWEVAVIDP